MTSTPAEAQTFILRVWMERDDASATPGELRGEVKHVPSGQSAYFRTLEGLPSVLGRLMDRTERDPSPGNG